MEIIDKTIILQRNIKIYLFKKSLKELQKYKLNDYTDFNKLTEILKNKDLLKCVKNIISKIINFSPIKNTIKPQIILTAYIFKNFKNEILSKDSNDTIDNEIIYQSYNIVNILENTKNINYLYCQQIKKIFINYNELFNYWKKFDETRTIQNCIVSYRNRIKHIEYIEKNNNDPDSLKVLHDECNDILNSIKMINKNINIDDIKNNYETIYNNIYTNMNNLYNNIMINMKMAYCDILKKELDMNELNTLYCLIKETNERLLLITPKKIYQSVKDKLDNFDFINILQINNWNKDIIEYIDFLIDSVVVLDCPANDTANKEWKKDMKTLIFLDYNTHLPIILLDVNHKIDTIVNMIKKIV